MSINTIRSSFYPDETHIDDGLLFNITLSVDIYSDIRYDGKISFTTNGNISTSINNISIILLLKFIKDNDGLISSVELYDENKCSVTIEDIKLDMYFDKQFLEFLIEILHDPIVNLIKSYSNTIVCESLQPVIKEYGSLLFTTIGNYIRPYINGSSSIDIPIDSSKMEDLRKSQIIDLINFLLTNLTSGDTPFNINSLINRFSRDTGILDYQDIIKLLEISPDMSFKIPVNFLNANGTINFLLKDFILSGLNTWKDFTILNPVSPFVLDTHTALDMLDVNLTFQLNVSLNGLVDNGNIELSETTYFHMNMENNSMDFLLQYAAEKGVGLNYSISQCTDPSCLLKLASINGTGFKKIEFNTSINEVDFESAEAPLEEETQKTINTIGGFFVQNYKSKIPVFLNGFINEFGRSYLNSLIRQKLKTSNCNTFKEVSYKQVGLTTTTIGIGFALLVLIVLTLLTIIVNNLRDRIEEDELLHSTCLIQNLY